MLSSTLGSRFPPSHLPTPIPASQRPSPQWLAMSTESVPEPEIWPVAAMQEPTHLSSEAEVHRFTDTRRAIRVCRRHASHSLRHGRGPPNLRSDRSPLPLVLGLILPLSQSQPAQAMVCRSGSTVTVNRERAMIGQNEVLSYGVTINA
jgi:hypothetical protein